MPYQINLIQILNFTHYNGYTRLFARKKYILFDCLRNDLFLIVSKEIVYIQVFCQVLSYLKRTFWSNVFPVLNIFRVLSIILRDVCTMRKCTASQGLQRVARSSTTRFSHIYNYSTSSRYIRRPAAQDLPRRESHCIPGVPRIA